MDQDTSEERLEVERARETVGDDVEALAYKANAPKRVKEQAAERADAAKAKVEGVKQQTTERIERTMARMKTDPRLQRAQNGARAAKDTVAGRRAAPAGGGDSRSPAERVRPAIDAVKRHPTAAGSAAIGATIGVLIGRATRRT